MIVAVEGPSAAGKTTWCRQHAARFVAEYVSSGREPGDHDAGGQGRYWASVNSDRWEEARDLEAETGIAVCDTDPLKLHYSWSLARIGEARPERFEREVEAVRAAMERCVLGFADVVLVTLPPLDVLRSRRGGDPARSRHQFELHSRLLRPLREWYEAVDTLRPGHVLWTLPTCGLAGVPQIARPDRSDPHLLDTLVDRLPPLSMA